MGAVQTQLGILQQESLPDLSRLTSDAVTITGHVVRSGLLRESTSFTRGDKPSKAERRQTIDIETEKVTLNNEAQTEIPITFGIRVNVHSRAMEAAGEESPELMADDSPGEITRYLYGDRLQFTGKLRVRLGDSICRIAHDRRIGASVRDLDDVRLGNHVR